MVGESLKKFKKKTSLANYNQKMVIHEKIIGVFHIMQKLHLSKFLLRKNYFENLKGQLDKVKILI